MKGMQLHAGDNYLARLNTITKLVITLFFSVFIIFMETQNALLLLFTVSILYVTPLKKWRVLAIGYALIVMMYAVSLGFSAVMGLISERMGAKGNYQVLIPFLRVTFMLNLTLALTLSSGVRRLTNVLKTIKVPRFIFLPTIVVFRFVPSFMNDIQQIHESIKIKVGAFNFFTMITKPRLFIRLMIIPAVIRSLRSAEELSAAAELKGISGVENVKNSTPESLGWRDGLAFSVTAVLVVTVVFLNKAVVA